MRASGVELYDNGDETYGAMETCMARARQHIHLEYYIFEPDAIGQRWRDLLTRKAREGVQVRVLVDALGSRGCTPRWWRSLTAAGGEVRYFNPPRLFKPSPGRVNFRTHRKIAVIDGHTAFTGGINVCEENSALQCGADAWRDTHLRVTGAPAASLQTVFFEDWMFAAAKDTTWLITSRELGDVPADIDTWFPTLENANGPWVQIVDSGPDESTADIHRYFFSAIGRARSRVWITTPYFVPDEPILTALSTASARGVDVRILIPTESDSKFVSAAASTYADQVVREGSQVWTYGPAMNHAKTMLVDADLAIVGTANMDNRSFRLNFEVIAAVYDRATNERLAEMFNNDLRNATPYAPGDYAQGFFNRLLASGARLFAPLL
jgi:cardiolipin synthase